MNAQIAIAIGSELDLLVMQDSASTLDKFGIPYELELLSPHYAPNQVIEYARETKSRGISVLIAGASGTAQLPGLLAAYCNSPVIAVPIRLPNSLVNGLEALYSMLSIPEATPVAVMGINAAKHAAIFAMQILSLQHPSYLHLVQAFKNQQIDQNQQTHVLIDSLGYSEYLKQSNSSKKG